MGLEIPPIHYMIAVAGGDTIRCAPYATYGTEQLSQHAVSALEDRLACLLAHHGMIAIGPSLSWDASAPLTRSDQHATLDFDWGVNAAVLFGRQKVQLHRRTAVSHYNLVAGHYGGATYSTHSSPRANPGRSRTVMIPNIGGFAGVSLKFPNAKVALGYRADLFFNAMDGGIDARKSENVGFYGPFATISVGL